MWYDTEVGISNHLGSLEDLNKLVQERRDAGYSRHERLKEFVILGKFYLDSCGNFSKIDGTLDFAHSIPKCVSWEHFCKEYRCYFDRGIVSSFAALPPPELFCAYCKTSWNIDNVHDVISESSSELIDLAPFVGKMFQAVADEYSSRQEAIYYVDNRIRNAKHIDLAPEYPDATEDWKKMYVKNKHGWIDIERSYLIQEGDFTGFQLSKYYHSGCHRLMICKESEDKFRNIFVNAGFNSIKMEEIPNQYCPCERCTPWYRVRTEFGFFEIGWRKRVISINWRAINRNDRFGELFSEENVTQDKDYIHAWGWDKAKEYMTKICMELNVR